MRIGVCSWSLQPESPADLAEKVAECGLSAIQLALDPLLRGAWDLSETKRRLADAGIDIVSAMVQTKGEDYTTLETIRATGGLRPDQHWETNLLAAHRAADMCSELNCKLVSFHAGFMPHSQADPEYQKLVDRIGQYAEALASHDVNVAIETGQESAATLAEFLNKIDSKNLGVNFDPANMILYGMGDPTASLLRLHNHVLQIHLKDAIPSAAPSEWGEEVPIGNGAVEWRAFFEAITESNINVHAIIEREAGDQRIADVRTGLEHLKPMLELLGASK